MTRLLDAMGLALSSIARTRGRSLFTVIGILIGVGAIVVVPALGTDTRRVGQASDSAGSNAIFVSGRSNTPAAWGRLVFGGQLTEADGQAIVQVGTSITSVIPVLSARARVALGDGNVATTVVGSSRGYVDVRGYRIAEGSNFTETDERLHSSVCILGETVRHRLFGSQSPIGEVIRIGRHPFRVRGVLLPKGRSSPGEDPNDQVVVPAETFRSRVLPTPPGTVHMLIASASDRRAARRVQAQIDAVLRQRHRIDDEHEPDFDIKSQADSLRNQEASFDRMRMLLVAVALISLGVGGIGIMNAMLVSVRERAHDIGLRVMAGAREKDILLQFLVEAVVLCMLGGLFGIAMGMIAVFAAANLLGWPMSLQPSGIVAALGASFAVGVLFGFGPARTASRIEPILTRYRE
jgi:putative ABC transport system permease protein